MGRVAGSYGVRGWLRVATGSDTLAACGEWSVGGREFAVEATKGHSGALLAKLKGIESPEQARQLKGARVEVRRAALPEPAPGIFYWDDLVGLEVVNGSGASLGRVKRLFNSGAHDVVEISGERTRLLPWVKAVVRRVDLGAGRIEVDWEADW